jgi:hypothetical protein
VKRVERADVVDWATYGDRREEIRRSAMAAKDRRRVEVGEHLVFLFENVETVRYQIQEMMRAERLVREADIRHEIDTYNELLGGPGELGCTLLVAIEDAKERPAKLKEWIALPEHVYVRLADGREVRARFDPRQRGEDRLSSVQYLKFAVGGEVPVAVGADHRVLSGEVPLSEDQRAALAEDLAG